MGNSPLFSIVIVNYNHGEFLEETILSILSQDCDDYELLIIDGGSTDSSISIIEKYRDKLDWWVSEKDTGQSQAFNKGFAKARGSFFFWVNADDILLPNAIQLAKAFLTKRPDTRWLAANTIFFDKNGMVQRCSRGLKWYGFLINSAPIYVYGPTSIFHRSLFEKIGGFDESLHYAMDTDLWMRFYNKGYRFNRVSRYFWGFRIHKDSKTSESLIAEPSSKHKLEQEKISKKNKHRYTKTGFVKQKIAKLMLGSYLLSYIDSKKYKGNNISNLKINQ